MKILKTQNNCTISSTLRGNPTYTGLPFCNVKETILGKRYDLELVFVGATRAQKLNKDFRNKDYTPNVLSFPLDDLSGQVFICPRIAEKEYKLHNFKHVKGYILYLFIHACLHLKGFEHGIDMEKEESKLLKKFS